MISDIQNVEQLSRVITQATAPAFLLGAVAGFASILTIRMERIMDRSRTLDAIPPDDEARAHLKADIPRLQRRARLINRAIFLVVGSGVASASLLFVAFACAFFNVPHEPGLAFLFSLALLLLMAALITLAMDVKIALSAFDHQA